MAARKLSALIEGCNKVITTIIDIDNFSPDTKVTDFRNIGYRFQQGSRNLVKDRRRVTTIWNSNRELTL